MEGGEQAGGSSGIIVFSLWYFMIGFGYLISLCKWETKKVKCGCKSGHCLGASNISVGTDPLGAKSEETEVNNETQKGTPKQGSGNISKTMSASSATKEPETAPPRTEEPTPFIEETKAIETIEDGEDGGLEYDDSSDED